MGCLGFGLGLRNIESMLGPRCMLASAWTLA